MTIQINLPPHVEAALLQRASEVGLDISTFVTDSLFAIEADTLQPKISDFEFTAKLDRIVSIHSRTDANFDDGRESIYRETSSE